MKTKTLSKILNLFFFALAIAFFFGCDKDNNNNVDDTMEPTLPSYIKAEKLFNCSSNTSTVADLDFQVNHVYEFSSHTFFGGFDGFLVKDEDGVSVVEEEYEINEMVEYNSKLMLCTDHGIFEVDSDINLTLKTDLLCRDMLISSKNELLFTTNYTQENDSRRIYKLNANGEVEAHTNLNQSTMCISFMQIAEASNGDLWGLTCSSEIARFRNGQYLDLFNEENSPFQNNADDFSIFLVPFQDAMILVSKNGVGTYQILKYKDEKWITLFDIADGNSEDDQGFEMRRPSLVDVFIYNNQLYLATTVASCRGFQVFDISKDELLEKTDYYVVQDPAFSSQCIDAVVQLPNGQIIVVVNDELTRFGC